MKKTNRDWQRTRINKMLALGRCVSCGMPAAKSLRRANGLSRFCFEHKVKAADYQRERKRRRTYYYEREANKAQIRLEQDTQSEK